MDFVKHFGIKKLRIIIIVFSVILINFGGASCSKDVYPSGLEGNLMGYDGNFKREQRKRERIARRQNRRTKRLEKQARKPAEKRQKRIEKERKELYKRHFEMQCPHVQKRMKQNLQETKRYYRSQKPLLERLKFWKKSSCP